MKALWLNELDQEELSLIKNFVLCSGSIKSLAKEYKITYPTMRLRLDRLIAKLEFFDERMQGDFLSLIKELSLKGSIDLEVAQVLIQSYLKEEEAKTCST